MQPFFTAFLWRVTTLEKQRQGVRYWVKKCFRKLPMLPKWESSLFPKFIAKLELVSWSFQMFSAKRLKGFILLNKGMRLINCRLTVNKVTCMVMSFHFAYNKINFYHVLIQPLLAQTIKNLPTVRETQIWSLGWEALLEKRTATHTCLLAYRIL